LTPEPARRAERALAAALAIRQAGMPHGALRMLALAEAGPLDELARARADLMRGRIAFTTGRADEAAVLLRGAATKLEPLDVRLAREAHLEATWAAWFVGQSAGSAQVRDAAWAARAAPPAPHPARPVDLLLDGVASRLTDGYAAGLPTLRRALIAFRSSAGPGVDGMRWLWLACANAAHMWDDEAWEALAVRQLQLARDAGDLAALLLALATRIMVHAYLGELSAAASLAEEQAAVVEATRSPLVPHGLLWVTAWQGREADAEELIARLLRRSGAPGPGSWPHHTVIAWVKALVCNSLGRYEEALAVAQPATERPSGIGPSSWGVLVELIEAAARSGLPERAVDALRRLTAATDASGTEWALGIQARCRALCSDGVPAETAYREAIDRLGRTRVRGELARAHLLYGEWLRRQNRRLDAREQLHTAHAMFVGMGMDAFARRAAHELQITGDTIRRRVSGTSTELTEQETQIVRLVGEGLTNPEIAARLFISPRTVEWHLNKIFTKLNITSRKQLRRPRGPLSAAV
jgi:DNA-binding CsgD family transcriptional regulator